MKHKGSSFKSDCDGGGWQWIVKHKGNSFKYDCDGGGGSGLSSTEAIVLNMTVMGVVAVGCQAQRQ